MDGGDLGRIAGRLRETGIKWLIGPKAWGGGIVYTPVWAEIARRLKANCPGLKVAAWGFCYPPTWQADAERASEFARMGADAIVLDVESHFEGKSIEANKLLARTRQSIGGAFPLYYSSFALPEFHKAFPWETFNHYCDGALPQVYAKYWVPPLWNLFPGYTDAVIAMYRQYAALGVGQERIFPVIDLWENGAEHPYPDSLQIAAFREIAGGHEAPSVSAWSYQHMDALRWWQWADVGRDLYPESQDGLADLTKRVDCLSAIVQELDRRQRAAGELFRDIGCGYDALRITAHEIADALGAESLESMYELEAPDDA